MYSMTGYASKVIELEDYIVALSIKALNSKFLDIRFRLPMTLDYFEDKLRRILKNYVKRGKVEIDIKLIANEQQEFTSIKSIVKKYYGLIKRLEEETDARFQVSLTEVLSMKNLVNPYEDSEKTEIPEEKIEEIFISTIEAFQKSRSIEGENTKNEILGFLKNISHSLQCIEKSYPAIVDKYKEQLKQKICELVSIKVDETRLMMEVGIYASKVDINEEISRIKGHVLKMYEKVQSDGECGRELDFIVQELNREINTIGSKIPDYSVSEEVVNVKSNLDKIKEQVRNIE